MDPNDFDEDTRSDADEQDEGDMSDMENPSECDVKPLFVNDLDPLVCQNNDCGGPLKVPIKQVVVLTYRLMFLDIFCLLLLIIRR